MSTVEEILGIKLTPEEKLRKARIQLLKNYPFFGYLALSLKFKLWRMGTFAVDDEANFYYNPKVVEKFSVEELMTVIAHEVMHLALRHNLRRGNRRKAEWNLACDLAINDILIKNGFRRLKGWAEPTPETSGKCAEEIYDMLPKLGGKLKIHIRRLIIDPKRVVISDGGFIKIPEGERIIDEDEVIVDIIPIGEPPAVMGRREVQIDEVIYKKPLPPQKGEKRQHKRDGKREEGCGDDEGVTSKPDVEEGWQVGDGDVHIWREGTAKEDKGKMQRHGEEWGRRLVEAWNYAKQRGLVPLGLEGYIKEIIEGGKVNWRELIWQVVQQTIPTDYEWIRPHKKSSSLGVYLPSMRKEDVDIVVALDTSGSISDKEYEEFLGEILSLARSFKNVKFTAILCDAEVHRAIEDEMDVEWLIEELKKRKGYGGTDFVPVFKWIEENKPYCKLLIYFTDLYGGFPKEKPRYPVIWVVSKEGDEEGGQYWKQAEKIGVVVKMD